MDSVSLQLAQSFLGKTVTVTIDRPIGSVHPTHGFTYPINYGFIADVAAPDGEELDAYCLGADQPIKTFTGTCIAIIHREDDDDDKLVVAPDGVSVTDEEIMAAVQFQEQWFTSRVIR